VGLRVCGVECVRVCGVGCVRVYRLSFVVWGVLEFVV